MVKITSKVHRTKYIQGDFENIITIIISGSDKESVEKRTFNIIELAKQSNALLVKSVKVKK